MKYEDKQAIYNSIADFEIGCRYMSPQQAELALVKILTPLLTAENYTVTYQDGPRDMDIDFLAEKDNTKVGIQYKHYRNKINSAEVYKVIGAAVVNKLDKTILLTNSSFSNQARTAAQATDPVAVELMDIEDLKRWASKIEADYEEENAYTVLKAYVTKLIELISKDNRTLDQIEWRTLEHVIAEVFDGLGFKTTLTPSSKDGGKDIILECKLNEENKSYIIEIKHWRCGQRVGEGKIREFLQVITKEQRDAGMFLSTYGFVDNAIGSLTQIDREKVKFGTETNMAMLCKTYIKKKSGLWQCENELSEILFQDTI